MYPGSDMNPTDPAGSGNEKQSDMETNYIWVLTNGKGGFIKACATREAAKKEMEEWRENFIKLGLVDVSKLDAVYYEHISFKVTDRNGNVSKMNARRTVLY